MKLYDLLESNVNNLVVKTQAVLNDKLAKMVKRAYDLHKHAELLSDDSTIQEFMRGVKLEISGGIYKLLDELELSFMQLAKDEVEARYGTITPYYDLDHAEEWNTNWKKLWWVGNIVVWLENNGSDLRTSGYFQATPKAVVNSFPDKLVSHINTERQSCVGIVVRFSHKQLSNAIYDRIADNIYGSGELEFVQVDRNEKLAELTRSIVATFAHEVTHLLQYIKTALAVQSTYKVGDQNLYAVKNFLPKRMQQASKIIDDDASKWSDDQWKVYLSRAIEVDAHAVTVAAALIQHASKNESLMDELNALTIMKVDLADGSLSGLSSSFRVYDRFIKPKAKTDKRYEAVWHRFLKKISTQLLSRIEELEQRLK